MTETVVRHAARTAGILAAFALIGTLLLTSVFSVTHEPILKSEEAARMALFRQIVPDGMHDNDLLKDVLQIPPSDVLGTREATQAHRARIAGQPAAVILEAVAPDGYSGDIKLLIAIRADGRVAGVRVLTHKETPGLGDYIDIGHGNWIKNFDGQSLAKTVSELWKVKKDGGQFEYRAGATITPRAVVKAVHKALLYFDKHRYVLFAVNATEQKS
jgi:electron transport complex protein RnfG